MDYRIKQLPCIYRLERLGRFYSLEIHPTKLPRVKIFNFNQRPLLESCLASLIPYFEMHGNFLENIASSKITQAISILPNIDTAIDSILAKS
nr:MULTISPECIES: hypothetical protein [unclassified Flavobacterium]